MGPVGLGSVGDEDYPSLPSSLADDIANHIVLGDVRLQPRPFCGGSRGGLSASRPLRHIDTTMDVEPQELLVRRELWIDCGFKKREKSCQLA